VRFGELRGTTGVMIKLIIVGAAVLGIGFPMWAEEPSATPTVFTAAQAIAGRTAYQSVCINCHTDSLGGRDGDEANELPPIASLSDEWQKIVRTAGGNGRVPPLAGPKFMARWATKTTQDFSTRVNSAVGGFPPKEMDETTYLNLTAYFLQMNGAQSGPQKLTSETAVVIKTTVPTTESP
jgi:mono/diheme cytochrome c family protein